MRKIISILLIITLLSFLSPIDKVSASGKTVKVIFTAITTDNSSIDDYAKSQEKENKNYLDVKAYDKDHVIVTMYDSYRKQSIKEFNGIYKQSLKKAIKDDAYNGAFTNIKADNMLKKVKIYANKSKYDDTIGCSLVTFAIAIMSDRIQALNLIDINKRKSDISIIDNKTNKVIYSINY